MTEDMTEMPTTVNSKQWKRDFEIVHHNSRDTMHGSIEDWCRHDTGYFTLCGRQMHNACALIITVRHRLKRNAISI